MRALRRHHREWLKKKRRFHWGQDLLLKPRHSGRVIDTPTPCSCYMCGNPRKHFNELTMQEKKAIKSGG